MRSARVSAPAAAAAASVRWCIAPQELTKRTRSEGDGEAEDRGEGGRGEGEGEGARRKVKESEEKRTSE